MLQQIQDKIAPDLIHLQRRIHIWRLKSDRIIFTNGCFDILHAGHIRYLAEARALGDRLIIGVNSDASIQRLKGSDRPVNALADRMLLLASLLVTDAIIAFDTDTPLPLIEQIEPDVLVKGGDWAVNQIVGADFVLSRGGEVRSIPFVDGYSTTGLIQKLQGKE